jgi:heavy metal sensor kinase
VRSIRLSLVLSFLVLLALTLGTVSVIVYRTAAGELAAKQERLAAMLQKAHQAKLDDKLLDEARALGQLVRLQGEGRNPRQSSLYMMGLLAGSQGFDAQFAAQLWILEGTRPLRDHLFAMSFKLKINELVLPEQEDQLAQFVQINGTRGASWRSDSLGEHTLPFDPHQFSGTELIAWHFDDPKLEDIQLRRVTSLRRVILKVSHFRVNFGPLVWGKGPGRRLEGVPRAQFPPLPQHTIFIQVAYDKSRTDGVLGRMQADLDRDLNRLERSSQETLGALRQTLLAVSMGAFVAALVGGSVLLRLGLAPLRRLSDAVSRVSEKDFRLPLDGARLPIELRPIVVRLEQTLDQLKRAFAREKQAAADLSHELRTPLAALMTTLDVALRKPRPVDQYIEVLQECRASGQHMYGLVERLLLLARLDAGVDNVRPREVDVGALAEQCAAMVRPLAEARGLSLRVHKDGAVRVKADPDKLREVFTNLLHNAIQYNRPDGAIDVAVARDNGDVRVEVRDTGIGIAPEARQLIFERFYRADPSRHSEELHAGLGLAIVKGYVDLMGGAIDVESTKGQGSTFRVCLPASHS